MSVERGRRAPNRREMLVIGAAALVTAATGALVDPARSEAATPKLPGEQGRVINQTTRYAKKKFDHLRVSIGGDQARLFIPQGIVPGSTGVGVLWLYHASGGSHDALTGGYKAMGERAVDLGMIAICQNLGGTLWTSEAALGHQRNGWTYLSGLYGIAQNHLRGTSHGGAMAVEVLATGLIPSVVGAYLVNPTYDLERQYLTGQQNSRTTIGAAFGDDLEAIRAHSPARHPGSAFTGTRLRVSYSQPDSSDAVVPPNLHAKVLIARASPTAAEASVRTHTSGHNTPSFADADDADAIARWSAAVVLTPTPTPTPEPTPTPTPEPPPSIPVPAPIARWDFAEAAAPYASGIPGVAALQQGTGSKSVRIATPFGGGVQFNGTTDWLRIPADAVGALNAGASKGAVTVAAWVLSTDTNNALIAGCWQESRGDPRRSYALFNDLPTYGGDDLVCFHVSKSGGATAGYPFSIDYSAQPVKITRGAWQLHVGTYDGAQAMSYLDGVFTPYPSYTDSTGATYAKNPYAFTEGLFAAPVDFVVGAGVRDGALINLHRGAISRLRVWDRALTPDEVRALYDAERGALG